MKYFAGIDVSLRSVSICVVDETGEVRHEAKVVAEIDTIVATLRHFSGEIRQVGFEAGTLTQYLTYGLSQAGFDVICLEARQVAASLAAMRNKTDRNDARGLAQILRTGWYRTVLVKSIESHQVRALLSSRKMILTKCIDLENELRGLLKVFGVRLPPRVGHAASMSWCARRCWRCPSWRGACCRCSTPASCCTVLTCSSTPLCAGWRATIRSAGD